MNKGIKRPRYIHRIKFQYQIYCFNHTCTAIVEIQCSCDFNFVFCYVCMLSNSNMYVAKTLLSQTVSCELLIWFVEIYLYCAVVLYIAGWILVSSVMVGTKIDVYNGV